jgi:hypothetical protein
MKSIEQLIAESADPQQVWDDCMTVLDHPAGQRLLRFYLGILPVFSSPLGATVEETHVNIGRCELFMSMFRRSQQRITASDMAPE